MRAYPFLRMAASAVKAKRVGRVATFTLALIAAPAGLGIARADTGATGSVFDNPTCHGIAPGTVHVIDANRGITSVESHLLGSVP